MVLSADQNPSRRGLLLEMALEAERLVAGDQHLRVDRSVWLVACGAALAQCLVFKYERPELRRVALAALDAGPAL